MKKGNKHILLPRTHPAVQACLEDDAESLRAYLAEGGDPYAISVSDSVNLILLAGCHGNVRALEVFADHGCDLICPSKSFHRGLLHSASELGQIDTIKFLLSKGIDPNVQDTFELSPLHEAVEHPDIVKALLEAGADPMPPHRQKLTPLHNAAAVGAVESMALLVNAGTPVDSLPTNKSTPLHEAAAAGRLEACEWLLDHGADPTLINRNKRTPTESARSCGHEEVAELIERFPPKRVRREWH